jgi:class 3 adenylate cyclase
MPHYLDRHDDVDVPASELARSHLADLAIQDQYDVDFLTYWFDPRQHKAYCLVSAPSAETAIEVHAEAHGNLPSEIIEVELGEVFGLLGRVADPELEQPDQPIVEAATRTIVFTDIVGSTALIDHFGDAFGMEMVRVHDEAVRTVLRRHGGREVKHTGDGLMLAFDSPVSAVQFSIGLQQRLSDRVISESDHPVTVRVGINTGEPITKGQDLFGAAVNLAARLCDRAEPGGILVSEVVRERTTEDGFRYGDLERLELKGFAEPIAARRVMFG